MKYIFIVLAVALISIAAIHPPNDNKLCARPGCGHYKNVHDNGNGVCRYADYIYVFPGHCEGFIR